MGKSEFGVYGVVGGMTVIVMLVYTMRLLSISPRLQTELRIGHYVGCGSAAVMSARQTYTVKHIRKGPALFDSVFSGCGVGQ